MSALEQQVVPMFFGQGVDTKSDSKAVAAGKMLQLENAVFQKRNKIVKRGGYASLSKKIIGSSAEIADAKKLIPFQNELTLVAGGHLYSYSESNSAYADRGLVSSVSITSTQIVRNTASQQSPDCATSQGVTVYAWEDSRGGVRATVIDENSGLPLQSDVQISATGLRPRVSATSNYLYVHYMDASNAFNVQRLNPLNPLAFETAASLATDANGTNPNFDVTNFGLNRLVCCYATTGNVVKVAFLTDAGLVGGVSDGLPAEVQTGVAGSSAVAIASRFQNDSSDGIYVFYHNTTNGLKCSIYDVALLSPTVVTVDAITTQVNQIGAIVQGDGCNVFYEVNATQDYNHFIKTDIVSRAGIMTSSGTTTGTGSVLNRALGIASKPFKQGDELFFVAVHDSALQPTYFTLRYVSQTRVSVVNTIAREEAGGLHTRRSVLTGVPAKDSTQRIFANMITSQLVSDSGLIFGLVGIQSTLLNFDDSKLYQAEELGKNLHIAGGLLQNYDGRSVTEHGFFLFPENFTNAITTSAGSIEAGSRQYTVVYEWTDNQGQLHQSAQGIELDVTNALNDKNTLTIPTLRITEKKLAAGRTDVSIAVYRTTATGTIFYRITSLTSPLQNDPTVDTVTFVDTRSDTVISANEILYTTGGIIENIQPESASVITTYNDRICLNAEDPNRIQYSKKNSEGLGVAFNDGLNFRADRGGKSVSALASLDEKLIVFKRNKILVQVGDGQSDSGTNDDFRTPPSIPSDVGCEQPQSIVEIPNGLMFKSNKGYYLLTRGLTAQYIGSDVEQYNDLLVTSANLIHDKNEVRFLHSNGLGLVYDFFENQWSTFANHESISACIWKDKFCFLRSDGRIYVESDTSYLDNGQQVKLKAQTSWVQLAGLKGAQRIYRLVVVGNLIAHHKLKVTIAYDFDEYDVEQFIFDSKVALGDDYFGKSKTFGSDEFFGGADRRYEFEICPTQQKCQAIRITIEDLNTEGLDSPLVELVGLVAVVGVKNGLYKVQVSKRVSES